MDKRAMKKPLEGDNIEYGYDQVITQNTRYKS